jgi:hypothetical protein
MTTRAGGSRAGERARRASPPISTTSAGRAPARSNGGTSSPRSLQTPTSRRSGSRRTAASRAEHWKGSPQAVMFRLRDVRRAEPRRRGASAAPPSRQRDRGPHRPAHLLVPPVERSPVDGLQEVGAGVDGARHPSAREGEGSERCRHPPREGCPGPGCRRRAHREPAHRGGGLGLPEGAAAGRGGEAARPAARPGEGSVSNDAAPARKVSLEQVLAVLEQVEKVAAKNPGRAREVLAGVMDPVVLTPTPEGYEASLTSEMKRPPCGRPDSA